VLPLWRSMHSLNLMLPKEERKAMLLRLYNDNSELIDHSKNRDREAKAKEAEAASKQEESVTIEADVGSGIKLDAKEFDVTKSEERAEDPSSETVITEKEKAETANGEKMETDA
jgi:multisite-specific tRNA:(cytosine-C5)-methyltransferase